MRRCLIILFVCLRINYAQAQQECDAIKNGYFSTKAKPFPRSYIERNDSIQIEYFLEKRNVYTVQWINPCVYTLKLKECHSGGVDCNGEIGKAMKTVTITKVTRRGYYYTVTMGDDPFRFDGFMRKERKPHEPPPQSPQGK